jgi:uncharacterized protein YggT (Ycf19 family)
LRVDFSRLTREFAVRFKAIWQKHGVFPSIETLDAFRYGKINPRFGLVDFSRLARDLAVRFKEISRTQEVSASIETLDAFRYGKINPRFGLVDFSRLTREIRRPIQGNLANTGGFRLNRNA